MPHNSVLQATPGLALGSSWNALGPARLSTGVSREKQSAGQHFIIMRKHLKLLLVAMSAGLLLAGCCAPRQVTQWEYKVATAPGNSNLNEVKEGFLAL